PISSVMSIAEAPSPPAVKMPDYNRLGLDFHRPFPRPKIAGRIIEFHVHLLARRHADLWFETAEHFGIDAFVSMTPLEEAISIQRDFGRRIQFIAIPRWQENSIDDWLRRLEGFYNIGSR